MSGFFKGVKKFVSKVINFIKPLVKYVVIAAAIYFTAGVAMSYFPATSAFAASLPGFAGGGTLGLGIGAGATAGTGVLSHLATAIGLGGGLAKGAALAAGTASTAGMAAGVGFGGGSAGAVTAAAPAVASSTAAGLGGALGTGEAALGYTGSMLAPSLTATGASAAATAAGTALGTAGVVAPTVAGAAPTVAATAAKMTLGEKLMLASVGTNALGGLFAPTPEEEAAAKAKHYGAFYGMDESGQGGAINPATEAATAAMPAGTAPATSLPPVGLPTLPAPKVGAAPQQNTALFQQGPTFGSATPPATGSRFEVPAPTVPTNNLFQPMQGVRYVA